MRAASTSSPTCGDGWCDRDCRCRSLPTSRSGGLQIPIRWRSAKQRTSLCSRCNRSVGYEPACEIAERIGLPVVVSSALETSIGIRAGLALAAALPELPYACGLNTVALLTDDLAEEPLIAVDGMITVSDLVVDQAALDKHRPSADTVQRFWQARLVRDSGAGRWVTPPRVRG